MCREIDDLAAALEAVRGKLVSMPITAPGFGEMRALHWELTDALIKAGDKELAVLAGEIEKASKAVADEWSSNKDLLGPWLDVLGPVVTAVGKVVKGTNPLLALLL